MPIKSLHSSSCNGGCLADRTALRSISVYVRRPDSTRSNSLRTMSVGSNRTNLLSNRRSQDPSVSRDAIKNETVGDHTQTFFARPFGRPLCLSNCGGAGQCICYTFMGNNAVASFMQGTMDLGACGLCCTDCALFLNGS
jgi:hypothetical protein